MGNLFSPMSGDESSTYRQLAQQPQRLSRAKQTLQNKLKLASHSLAQSQKRINAADDRWSTTSSFLTASEKFSSGSLNLFEILETQEGKGNIVFVN